MAQFFNKAIKFLHLDKLFISNNKDIKELNKMITPKQTLKNPYYFIRNEIIYNISFNQDKDKCGQQLVDESEEVNKSRFPNFTVNYTDENSEQLNVIYWLQDMIQDGDRYDGSKFIQDENHGDGDYITTFQNEIKEEVKKLIESGKTIQQIKSTLPHYYFEPSINPQENKKTIVIDGCKKYNVTYNGVEGLELITDDEMLNQVYNVANQHAIECANNVLNDYGLEISEDLIEKGDIISKTPSVIALFPSDHHERQVLRADKIELFSHLKRPNPGTKDTIYTYPDIETSYPTYPDGHVYYYLFNPSIIEDNTFAGLSDMRNVEIGENVTSINNEVFKNCNGLYTVTISNSVKFIGNQCFSGCTNLFSVTFGTGVTSTGLSTFSGCTSLTKIGGINDEVSIKLPNNIKTIGGGSFNGCTGLTNVTLPDSIKDIGPTSFMGCTSLTNVTIGNGIKSINNLAFMGCSNLQSVTINATTPPTIISNPFGGNASGRKFYVPAASVEEYKTAEGWSQYADDILPIQ